MDEGSNEASALLDPQRLLELRETGLLDSDAEEEFDRLTRLAARVIGAPVSLMSLITGDRSFFKSATGLPPEVAHIREVPLSHSVCQYVVSTGAPLLVENASLDATLASNGAVQDMGLVAYAGVPLRATSGNVFGSLCVIDLKARTWSKEDLEVLEELARSVIAHVELRLEVQRRRDVQAALETRQRKLDAVLEFSPAITYNLRDPSRDAGSDWVSANVERILGYTVAEALQPSWFLDNVHPDDAANGLRLSQPLEEHEETVADYRFRHKAGHYVMLQDRVRTQLNVDGRAEIVGCLMDVTWTRHAEDAVRTVYYRSLLAGAIDLIQVIDAAGVIRYESPSVKPVLGYDPGQLVEQSIFDFIHPEDAATVRASFETTMSDVPDEVDLLFRFRHSDGSWRMLEGTGRNMLDMQSVRGIVLNARDVTDRRQLEEEYRQAQKMEAVGRFASGVAHDMNNILTVIAGNAEMLRSESNDSSAQESISEIFAATDTAKGLSERLLAFTRRRVRKPAPVELEPLVSGVEKMLQRLIGAAIVLRVHHAEYPVWVQADSGELQQVLLNLAVNARDAMPAGGDLTIRTIALDGDSVQLSVQDSGTGMSEEVRARIFEPFFTTKDVGEGTGLGLATVYAIMERAGGSINVVTEMGMGTTFQIVLPRIPAPEPELLRAVGDSPPRLLRKGGSVLLVEDEHTVRRFAARVLERAGFTVLQASDGEEGLALAFAHADRIDVMITDLALPKLGGYALACQVAASAPHIRIIIASGDERNDAEGGAIPDSWCYLQKPFTITDLLDSIQSIEPHLREPSSS